MQQDGVAGKSLAPCKCTVALSNLHGTGSWRKGDGWPGVIG